VLGLPVVDKAVLGLSPTPALLGVGYILGRRIGTIMVGGGLLSWMVIIPVIAWQFADTVIGPETLAYLRGKGLDPGVMRIGGLSAKQIWEGYIRIIGAGAVAAAGIITVIKSLPTMVESLRIGLQEIRSSAMALDDARLRTEKDLSIRFVILGVLLIIMVITVIPGIIGQHTQWPMRLAGALAIALFAFCFVTVSSRIVGLIGVSSNPTSGMAIVTLMGTGLLFRALGWTDMTGKITALTIGTIVCIAASIAGDISQDLKAGFIIGATPRRQQLGEILGILGSAAIIAFSVFYLGRAYEFGSEDMPAPQATLMKTVLDGVLDGHLRWDLAGVGALFAILVIFLKIPPLPFAVGMYLPLYTMTPVFIGGMLRHFIDRNTPGGASRRAEGRDQGILLGSGFIAGEGLMGIVIAVLAVLLSAPPKLNLISYPASWVGELVSALMFTALGAFLYRVAIRSRRGDT